MSVFPVLAAHCDPGRHPADPLRCEQPGDGLIIVVIPQKPDGAPSPLVGHLLQVLRSLRARPGDLVRHGGRPVRRKVLLDRIWRNLVHRIHAQFAREPGHVGDVVEVGGNLAQSQRCWSEGDKAGAKSWSEAGKHHQTEMRNAKQQSTEKPFGLLGGLISSYALRSLIDHQWSVENLEVWRYLPKRDLAVPFGHKDHRCTHQPDDSLIGLRESKENCPGTAEVPARTLCDEKFVWKLRFVAVSQEFYSKRTGLSEGETSHDQA